jgi:hypothetical protein
MTRVPPYRMRDLGQRERWLAAALLLAILAPFVLTVVRAIDSGWYPLGDDAYINLQAYGVMDGEFPLVGLPSTSYLYSGEQVAHPGPIEFYWLAVPQRLLGPALGTLLAMAVVYASSVLVAAWIVFRRAGPMPGAIACIGLAGVLSVSGGALLIDPLSSNAGGLPLLALFASAAAVAQGDIRLLPITVVYGSWVAQQHLAIVLPAVAMVGIAVLGVIVAVVRLKDRAKRRVALTRVAAAAGLGVVLWLPVIVDQLFGSGNLTAMLGYSGSGATSVPPAKAAGMTLRAFAAPTLLVRTDVDVASLLVAPTGLLILSAVVTLMALLAAVTWAGRRSRGARVWLGATLLLTAAGFVNTTMVPDSLEQLRMNFYRWAPVVGFGVVVVFGWVATEVAGKLARRSRTPLEHLRTPIFPALVGVAVLPVLMALVHPGRDDRFRGQDIFDELADVRTTVLADSRLYGPVALAETGVGAVLVVSPMIDLALTVEGHTVRSIFIESNFGDPELLQEPPPALVYSVNTSDVIFPFVGQFVGRWDVQAELGIVQQKLLAQYVASPNLEVADDGPERVRTKFGDLGSLLLFGLPTKPVDASKLNLEALVRAVSAGYYKSHPFDPALIAEFERLTQDSSLFGDRYITIMQIDETEYRRVVDRPSVIVPPTS